MEELIPVDNQPTWQCRYCAEWCDSEGNHVHRVIGSVQDWEDILCRECTREIKQTIGVITERLKTLKKDTDEWMRLRHELEVWEEVLNEGGRDSC